MLLLLKTTTMLRLFFMTQTRANGILLNLRMPGFPSILMGIQQRVKQRPRFLPISPLEGCNILFLMTIWEASIGRLMTTWTAPQMMSGKTLSIYGNIRLEKSTKSYCFRKKSG